MNKVKFKAFVLESENENLTNGDVLLSLFPGIEVEFSDYVPLVNTNLDGSLVSFRSNWWNAPYTGEGGGEK